MRKLVSFLPFYNLSDERKSEVLESAKSLVQFFYYFVAFHAFGIVNRLSNLLEQEPVEAFEPIWTISWMRQFLSVEQIFAFTQISFFFIALATAFFYRHRLMRAVLFLSFVEAHSVLSSISGVEHQYMPWLYVLFFLVFLPDSVWKSEEKKEDGNKFLTYIWGAQAFVLLGYTMAGLNKLVSGISQAIGDSISIFSSKGLPLIVAYWTDRYSDPGLLSSFLIEHEWISWAIAIFSIYFLTVSIIVAFRSSLHRVWGGLLALYHIGTLFALNLIYFMTPVVVIFFLIGSPFAPPKFSLREAALDLPIFGDLARILKK